MSLMFRAPGETRDSYNRRLQGAINTRNLQSRLRSAGVGRTQRLREERAYRDAIRALNRKPRPPQQENRAGGVGGIPRGAVDMFGNTRGDRSMFATGGYMAPMAGGGMQQLIPPGLASERIGNMLQQGKMARRERLKPAFKLPGGVARNLYRRWYGNSL